MSNQHPITPPDKQLVRKWIEDWAGGQMKGPVTDDQLIVAAQAAQWGADQELEACCAWLREFHPGGTEQLRCSRRPQPPSLKEQALAELDRIPTHDNEGLTWGVDVFIIRQALEALPND
jgi:hypothetical protein